MFLTVQRAIERRRRRFTAAFRHHIIARTNSNGRRRDFVPVAPYDRTRYKDAMSSTPAKTVKFPGNGESAEKAIRSTSPLFVFPDGPPAQTQRPLAEERPVALTYNGEAYAVMLATPADLKDFATGFSLSESIVSHCDEITAFLNDEDEAGLLLHMEIPPHRMDALRSRPRTLPGQTGCGLCGVTELEAASRNYPRINAAPEISPSAVFAALSVLPDYQTLNAETGAVHAAAFADASGTLLAVREDVGRHNAFDKLIGHLARQSIDPATGWGLLTSRCSIELVQKAMAARIPALAAISAPTGLAVDFAKAHALTLLALARSDGLLVFNDPFDRFA